ncbi:uncharacterized protein GGS25DRAFT_270581 [Hypoxylon fragiforme]|uniref:uncharacterized protein n=1 Tax=Hypoxylon fragiforme TaxID=63214 RepID=UPI0020C67739|nr:uncharacterized protein GGS25DRAFT_270581 [Hypoxylon fragiforme]KAI2608330.1 hypothetical protein GGS25DRAFT_270581 [Hypoxylon fragiforme]
MSFHNSRYLVKRWYSLVLAAFFLPYSMLVLNVLRYPYINDGGGAPFAFSSLFLYYQTHSSNRNSSILGCIKKASIAIKTILNIAYKSYYLPTYLPTYLGKNSTKMAAARYSPDNLSRREASPRPKNAERRRPRLLRACATEPSITTSNACKGVLTAPNTSRRATDLLSRVAISNASSSPPSARNYGIDSAEGRDSHLSQSETSRSACYFSFPSFDAWEVGEHPDEEKTERAP